MFSLAITVPGDPRGKGRPRATAIGGHARMYTDAKTASYENLVALAAREALDGRPPLDMPLCVCIVVRLAPPASLSGVKRRALLAGDAPILGRFDLDNICKAALDGMNHVAFVDDRQIVALEARKVAATTPGLDITLTPWAPARLTADREAA